MKRWMPFILLLILILSGCGHGLQAGSERTYGGTVTDRGMSVVKEGDRQGRAYIIIATGEEELCFWLATDCETDVKIGDTVIIESAIEEQTNLLVATEIRIDQNPACFHRPGQLFYFCAFASLRSSLVLKNFSSSGTRIRQISAAVKPPLYRQKPPWRVGTEVTSR